MKVAEPKPQWLAEGEAAEYIGMSVAYLKKARVSGTIGNRTPGPAFHRMGRRAVRYSRADLDAWLASHRVAERAPAS
jgi:predicted DNA-binding transcriptional regulator AlpA